MPPPTTTMSNGSAASARTASARESMAAHVIRRPGAIARGPARRYPCQPVPDRGSTTMLRIDETSKTLVAPQEAAFVAEAPPAREELLALVSAGWQAFAAEIGRPNLTFCVAGAAGADVLALDAGAGRVAVIQVAETPGAALSAALTAAGAMSARDTVELAAIHDSLGAAVPGDSPEIVLVGSAWDQQTLTTMDWLVRRHGLELSAYVVQMLRFGSERLLDVTRAYPSVDVPAPAPDFFAQVTPPPPPLQAGVSAPPPGIPAA